MDRNGAGLLPVFGFQKPRASMVLKKVEINKKWTF